VFKYVVFVTASYEPQDMAHVHKNAKYFTVLTHCNISSWPQIYTAGTVNRHLAVGYCVQILNLKTPKKTKVTLRK